MPTLVFWMIGIPSTTGNVEQPQRNSPNSDRPSGGVSTLENANVPRQYEHLRVSKPGTA